MIIGLIQASDKLHKPVSDLSLDWRASRSNEFPYELREAGRQKELDNIYDFDCVEDYSPSPQEAKKACSMIWVEEWRGGEYDAGWWCDNTTWKVRG